MKVCPRLSAFLATLMLAGQANGQADANATLSGTINYFGPVTGPVVVWAFENGQKVTALTLPNGPGPYSMQLPMNRNYDIKAFRDGDTDGELDHGWQVGEPYAHHGDWNSTSSSFNTFLLDGNKTGIDLNIAWHNDSDGDGFYDWDEYVAGSEGNDSSSTPGIGYGLVAHWTFDETNGSVLGGSSANEINGTLVGFGSNPSAHWVPGKTGGSLRFDGVDDYISFPGASPLDDLRPFSFAGWIKLDQNGSGYVLAKRSLESGYWRFFASGPTKNWLIRQTTGTPPSLATTEATPFFQWQHVALTWNGLLGGQNSSIYLDGTLVSNITQTSGSGELTSDVGNLFTLGNRPQNNSSFFKGWMDDFRIWNRVLLPHEVNTLHQGPSFPLTDANFTQAIDLWFSDQATATATFGHIRDWNVSGVTNMANAFQNRSTFNVDIGGWDVGNVTSMSNMFRGSSLFNQPIGNWNVSSVTDMHFMFHTATNFNHPIGNWNVSSVTNMKDMFLGVRNFNHPIGDWNVSSVTNMQAMFVGMDSFNQPIGNWNVSSVTNMHKMFNGALDFNQDISDWNTSSVTQMEMLFKNGTSFNQDLSNWNTSTDVNMTEMFENTPALSNANKGLMHDSFKNNNYWPYDWSAYADANAILSGTVNYSGPVTGPVVVWAFENGQKVAELILSNGPGPYSLQLPKNRNYDVKAFRDGNGNGNLDAGWQVGEPYAHHGDWNSTTNSFNTLLLDENKTGIDLNITWHNDHDGDGFLDWDEYVAGSEGNDSNSTPGLNFGLVAWYPFDGNASDMSGNGNHGTVHGATLGTDRHGRAGQAYSFDGVDDYIRIASSQELRELTEYTVSVWAWSQNFSTNFNPLVFKSSGDVSSFEIYGGNGFTLIHNRSSTYKYQYYSALPSLRWNHLLISYSNGTLSKYDDGSLNASSTGWANPEHHDFPLNIGKSTWQNEGGKALFYHHGSIDDVRIYDRALSASEVEKLYYLERPGSPITDANFTTAVALWFSDEANATATYGHIRDWNVTGVTDMSNAFKDRTTFNEDISGWEVSNVMNMAYMFKNASAFNQPIGDWNTFAVTNMGQLFYGSTAFNQDIGDWNVSAITNMKQMFSGATNFNQPVGNWDVSSVTNMWRLFHNATSFDQDIGDWNVSSLTISAAIFSEATSFDQDVGDWDLSNVTNMNAMFNGASSFNQDVGNWDVSSVSTMGYMFRDATAFNQDLSNWSISTDANMTDMFFNTPALSNTNKGLMHTSFKNNTHWPYDWSAHVAAPPSDTNGTNPPTDNNQTQTDQNATAPAPGDPAPTLFRPLPKTLAREELGDNNFRLWGQILADGGSPVTGVAFELADNMVFRNSSLQPASLFPSSPNFYLELTLEPGKRYYYRAVATNAVGTTFGSPKRLTTPGDSIHWWSDTVLTQGGWRTSPWLGIFRRHANTEWIYHAKLGWAYAHPDGSGGLWLWFREKGWLWTQPGVYPHLFRHADSAWIYLLKRTADRAYFYNHATGGVE